MPTIHETTFNTKLAEILRSKNPQWQEEGVVAAEAGRTLIGTAGVPDILFNFAVGMPIVIESEFVPARKVEDEAKGRLRKTTATQQKLIEKVIALCVPRDIKQSDVNKLEQTIRNNTFDYCIYSVEDSNAPPMRWPQAGWLHGGVDELVALIENIGISEQLIERSLQTLEGGVSGACARLMDGTKKMPNVTKDIAALLHQSDGEQTMRMAMAIISNALTFHQVIAGAHAVKNLAQLREDNKLYADNVAAEWERIVDEINYFPIFDIAHKILCIIPPSLSQDILDLLVEVTRKFFDSGLMGSHDLYGRMFQRLIVDRKFLATFYTLPESATLLAEIAVNQMDVDWNDADAVTNLRIGDFACGTGTLISAAYHSALARHRRAGNDDSKIHKTMIEKSLIATDIMPAGVHLAVSILASIHPTVLFDDTKMRVLPYGAVENKMGDQPKYALGALDLLVDEKVVDIFAETHHLSGTGESTVKGQDDPAKYMDLLHTSCDLVIMNPPFTRPTNHEITTKIVPSFGGFGTSEDEQKAMSARLKKIQQTFESHAGDGYAGLASNFIDLAHQKLNIGGVLAMVLPSTFAQGASWEKSRQLINANYDDIMVISIADNGSQTTAFSADTDIAEVLLIGKKRKQARTDQAEVKFLSLKKRPANSMQSAIIAHTVISSRNGLFIGGDEIGQITISTLAEGGSVGVADNGIISVATALQQGSLKLLRMTESYNMPITKFGEVATRGLVHRLINGQNPRTKEFSGPFDIIPYTSVPAYPCLWSHNAEQERSFIVKPDTKGRIRKGMKQQADDVWQTSSTLHFTLDFRLTSQSLTACVTPDPTLGGRAWPNCKPYTASHEAAIVLWANSTLGLLLWWYNASRQQAGRANMTISKLPELPFLDTRKLTAKQHRLAKRLFNQFKTKTFLPANEAYHDENRHALDESVLVQLLGLPKSILAPLDLLRKKWCYEPSVHGGKSTRYNPDA